MINVVSNWTALAVNVAVGFVLTPCIIRALGTTQYGIWSLVASIIGYYGLLDLGISSAIIRYVARYAGQRNHLSLNQVINTAIAIFSLIGSIVFAVSILGADPLARFFNVEAHDYIILKKCIWLLGGTAAIMFPGNVLGVAIIAHEHFVLRNMVNIICSILRCCLCLYILNTGGGLVAISWVNVALAFFGILLNLVILKIFFKHITLSLRLVRKSLIPTLLSFGFFTSITQIGNLMRNRLDTIIIGRYLNMDVVAIYSIAALLVIQLSHFIISGVGVSQPRLASLAGQNREGIFKNAILKYSIIASNLTAGVGLVLFLLCSDFIKLWIPKNFENAHATVIMVGILLLVWIPDLMMVVFYNGLQAVKKHKYYAYQSVFEGVAHLVISLLLVRSLGIYGIALGGAIPSLAAKFIIQPIYCCKIFQINWWQYMTSVILKPLSVAGGLIVVLKTSKVLFIVDSYPLLIFKGVIILLLYSTIAYFVCLDKQTRLELLQKFANIQFFMRSLLSREQAAHDSDQSV
jgi:O-antigen/teichoic acid export membrane protein